MTDAFLSKDAELWLGNTSNAVNLGGGAGGFSLTGSAQTVAVEALGRSAVLREAVSVDNAANVTGVFDGAIQDYVVAAQGRTTRTLAFYQSTSAATQDRCLIGPVLTDSLALNAPYNDLVTAVGNMPASGEWLRCRATPFSIDQAETFTPGGTHSQAYLVITNFDSTRTISTWTFAGTAVSLTGVGIIGPVATTAANLVVTATTGTGTVDGFIASGVPITIS